MALTASGSAADKATVAAKRLALALRAGGIGTWHWDLVTGVIERDASLDEILGVESGSGMPSFDEYVAHVHPEDRPTMGRNLQAAFAAHSSSLSVEHRIVRSDGEVRWLEVRADLSYATDGSPTEIVGVVVDVTERHLSQQERAAAYQARELAMERAGAVERRIALLARAADLLDTPLNLDAALQQVADLAIDVLADWCTVDLLTEGQRLHRAAVAHRDPAMVARAQQLQRKYPQDTSDPAFRDMLARRQPVFVEEFDDGMLAEMVKDPEQRDVAREFHISSFLVVPLVAGGKGIGTINLIACHGRHLDPEDVELAVDLGRRAGAAIEKTRLYDELRETSQVLQASLLPASLPEIPGTALSAHYRSGTEGMQIGGDFYDVFRTGPDRWWVALGDVCGKGPAAAALTAAVRYSVRAVAPDTTDPAVVPRRPTDVVLRRLNDVLLDQMDESQFTTVVLATFRAEAHSDGTRAPAPLALSVASAGHPAPLHLAPGRGATPVPCAGTVVGLLPDIEVTSVDIVVAPGETLLFYTDGATEARTLDGRLVGEERLAVLFEAHDAGPSDSTAARIAEALLGLTGGMLRDDLAMLTLGVESLA